MWWDVPFARQPRPVVGVLRMCWLFRGSFDYVCCPHTPVLRPSTTCLAAPPPPPPSQRGARFWFRRQKCGNTGPSCLGQPVLLRSTYHRTHVADISQPHPPHDYKRVPNTPACTPEHKSTWYYSHTNTSPPIQTLPAACTTLQTTFSIEFEPQKRWFQKSAETWSHRVWTSPCSDRGGADWHNASVFDCLPLAGGGGGYVASQPLLSALNGPPTIWQPPAFAPQPLVQRPVTALATTLGTLVRPPAPPHASCRAGHFRKKN